MGKFVGIDLQSDTAIDWDDAAIFLGSQTGGFEQQVTRKPGTGLMEFNIHGCGVNVPIIVFWKGIESYMDFTITFNPPSMTIAEVQIGLVGAPTVLEPVLVGVPNIPEVIGNTTTPDMYIEIMYTNDDERVGNMCKETTFTNDDWSKPKCEIKPATYAGMTVRIMMRNFNTGTKTEVLRSGVDIVSYLAPLVTNIEKRDDAGTPIPGIVDLMGWTDEDRKDGKALIYITGSNLPVLSQVDQRFVKKQGYDLLLMPSNMIEPIEPHLPQPVPVSICEAVLRDSSSLLICYVKPCVDVRWAQPSAEVAVSIGDRLSPAMSGKVSVPKPKITGFAPLETGDVPLWDYVKDAAEGTTFEFWGENFAGSLSESEDLEQKWGAQCLKWKTDPPKGYGVKLFAAARVWIGHAPCYTFRSFVGGITQNESYVACKTYESMRDQREPRKPGEVFGRIIRKTKMKATFAIGRGFIPMEDVQIDSKLIPCPEGYKRNFEAQGKCERCPKGFFSSVSIVEYPLQCQYCPETGYNDAEGARICKTCPENTVSTGLADDISACRCKPGYYSQYLDPSMLYGMPGKKCSMCHADIMTVEPPKGIECGTEVPLVSLCDEPTASVCVMATETFGFRVCRAYCAGNTQWPRSKAYFYLTMNVAVGKSAADNVNATGKIAFQPFFVKCEPVDACLPDNECSEGYIGNACEECGAGYYRDLAGFCVMCDDSAVVGLIIMGCVMIVLSVGAFFGSMVYMKLNSDPNFKIMLQTMAKEVALAGVKAVKPLLAQLKKGASKRVAVRFEVKDVCKTFPWMSQRELGIIYRADSENRRVHVAAVRIGSPAHAVGVQPNWVLLLANKKPMRAYTDEDVALKMSRLELPIDLVFRAPKKHQPVIPKPERPLPPGRIKMCGPIRLMTMTLGVLQSFNAISKLALTWPPMFKKISAFIGQFMLSFDFFRPECSVASPWEYKWFFQLILPYMTLVPLVSANMLMRAVIMRVFRSWPDFCEAQSWLLFNALARTINAMMLVFFPMHLEQLTGPFQCLERDDGTIVMRLAQEIPCDTKVPRYFRLCCIGGLGYFGAGSVFALFITMCYNSYHWQSSRCRRDIIPIYVAMVEVCTEDMYGYIKPARRQVLENVVALKMFPDGSEGANARRLMDKLKLVYGGFSEDVGQQAKDISKGKRRWRLRNWWPQDEDLPGSVLCYGWVVMINTITRQFIIMLIVTFTCNFPAMGAAYMCLMFVTNTLALILFRPYAFDFLNWEEGFLTGNMGLLCWMACFREMLLEHFRAHEYPQTLAILGGMVDVCTCLVVGLIGGAVTFNILLLALMAKTESEDQAFNRMKAERVQEQEKVERHAENLRLAQLLNDGMQGGEEFDLQKLEDEVHELVARLAPCDRPSASGYFQTMIDVELASQRRQEKNKKGYHVLGQIKRGKVEEQLLINTWVYGSKFQYNFVVRREADRDIIFEEEGSGGNMVRAMLALSMQAAVGSARTYTGFLKQVEAIDENEVVGAVKLSVRRSQYGEKPVAVLTKVFKTAECVEKEEETGIEWKPNFETGQMIFAHISSDCARAKEGTEMLFERVPGHYDYMMYGHKHKFSVHKNRQGDLIFQEGFCDHGVLVGFLQPADLFEHDGPYLMGHLKLKRTAGDDAVDFGVIRMRMNFESDSIIAKLRRSCDEDMTWADIQEMNAPRHEVLVGKRHPPTIGARVCLLNGHDQMLFPEGTIVALINEGQRVQVRHDDHLGSVRYYNTGRENHYELVFMDEEMEAAVDKRVSDEVTAQVLQVLGTWSYGKDRNFNLDVAEEGHLTFEEGPLKCPLLPDGPQEFGAPWRYLGQLKKGDTKCGFVRIQYAAEEGKMHAKIKPPNTKQEWDELTGFESVRVAAPDAPEVLSVTGAAGYDGRYILMESAQEEEANDNGQPEGLGRPKYWLRQDRQAHLYSEEGFWHLGPALGNKIDEGVVWKTRHPHFGCQPQQVLHSQWSRKEVLEWEDGNNVYIRVASFEDEEDEMDRGKTIDFGLGQLGSMPRGSLASRADFGHVGSRHSRHNSIAEMFADEESFAEVHKDAIWVQSPWLTKAAGLYDLVPSREANGYPIWKQLNGQHWLFAGVEAVPGDGSSRWFIGDDRQEEVSFSLNGGVAASTAPHSGQSPESIKQDWQTFDEGQKKWVPAPEIRIERLPPIPHMVQVRSQSLRECDGKYEVVDGAFPNGLPIWKQRNGKHYLFSGPPKSAGGCKDYRWFIAGPDAKRDEFASGQGVLCSKDIHYGTMPDRMEAWYKSTWTDKWTSGVKAATIDTEHFQVDEEVWVQIYGQPRREPFKGREEAAKKKKEEEQQNCHDSACFFQKRYRANQAKREANLRKEHRGVEKAKDESKAQQSIQKELEKTRREKAATKIQAWWHGCVCRAEMKEELAMWKELQAEIKAAIAEKKRQEEEANAGNAPKMRHGRQG
eukprot:TRINITY_DN61017_c0_g2_i1.p1 TRINITY_DN61017_c0_g2~~TRINITY_DN61017_c0_g2_i1.p1  ORF type:complete len:2533 (+),score=513.92 TRINITY_DN61017_c0_g2_i1:326-7600(+)